MLATSPLSPERAWAIWRSWTVRLPDILGAPSLRSGFRLQALTPQRAKPARSGDPEAPAPLTPATRSTLSPERAWAIWRSCKVMRLRSLLLWYLVRGTTVRPTKYQLPNTFGYAIITETCGATHAFGISAGK